MFNTPALEPISEMPTGTEGFAAPWAFDGAALNTDYTAFHSEGGAATMSVWSNGDGTYMLDNAVIVPAK